jgi:hypothetical protein
MAQGAQPAVKFGPADADDHHMPHADAAQAPSGMRELIPAQRKRRRDKRNAQRVVGHQLVADILSRRPPPSGSWHHLPGGINHVHISPTGVFAIMDVCVPGQMAMVMSDTVLIGSRESDLIARADAHGDTVAARLAEAGCPGIPVRTLVVFTHYRRLIVRNSPTRATVLSTTGLRDWLDRRADLFTESATAQLLEAAGRAATWGLTSWPPAAWSTEDSDPQPAARRNA